MGIFKRNKVKSEEKDILEMMYAPQIPGEIHPWLAQNQIKFPPESFLSSIEKAFPNSWFNVEVASMMVSTRIPPACENCSDKETCSKCGKSKENFRKINTASSDGDYFGWDLLSDESLVPRLMSDGFLVSFDKSIYSSFRNTNQKLSFESQPLVPILISEMKTRAHAKDISMLYFADAFAKLNGDDFIASLIVPEGLYSIIAWLGYTNTGEIAPMAVTVLGENLLKKSGIKPLQESDMPSDIRKCITESLSGNVLARIGRNMFELANANSENYNPEDPQTGYIGHSWILQAAYFENREEFDAIRKETFNQRPEHYISMIDSLRIRGMQDLAMEMIKELKTYRSDEISEGAMAMLKIMETCPPGAVGVNP